MSPQLIRSGVMVGGNTQVFWTVTKRLHVWGGKFAVLSLHTFCRTCLRRILHVGLWCGAICGTCLVVCAKRFFCLMCSLSSTNSCLCDCWGKYSGVLNCHQAASRMGGKFAALSLHTFCRASLSCCSNTASIDYVCNLVLSFLYS